MTLLAKWLRRASSIFSEKPEVKADDFGHEHIMLYHGLAGSSPENQRQFKDVRSDLLSAVSRKNSQNLCIILKIAPLWWEDKLQRIFAEAASDMREQTLASLLPETSAAQEVGQIDPLWHDDWRVRANAANALNFLQVREAEDRLIESLHATARDTSPAYCHLARSLAGFQNDKVKSALAKHLAHPESWIRVDSVNALAKWPLDDVADLLVSAFTDDHDFTDYASVAVARAHNPIELLQRGGESTDLAATIIVGAMEAAAGSFSSNSDLLTEIDVQKCLAPLLDAAKAAPSPVRLRALVQLSQWLDNNYHLYRLEAEGYPTPEEISAATTEAEKLVQALDISGAIESTLAGEGARNQRKSAVVNAIKLAGEQQLKEALPALKEMLVSAPVYQNDVIETIGIIGDAQCAALLVQKAKDTVNMERRTASALNANPIFEEAPEKAKAYWLILRALGNLQSEDGLAFLLSATQDEAADKREEALASIIKVCAAGMPKGDRAAEIKATLQNCLADPSPQVRIKACEGAAALNASELINTLTALINAQEKSLSRAALQALEQLAAAGHKEPIRAALNEAKKGQSSSVKVKRIDDFIQHHL